MWGSRVDWDSHKPSSPTRRLWDAMSRCRGASWDASGEQSPCCCCCRWCTQPMLHNKGATLARPRRQPLCGFQHWQQPVGQDWQWKAKFARLPAPTGHGHGMDCQRGLPQWPVACTGSPAEVGAGGLPRGCKEKAQRLPLVRQWLHARAGHSVRWDTNLPFYELCMGCHAGTVMHVVCPGWQAGVMPLMTKARTPGQGPRQQAGIRSMSYRCSPLPKPLELECHWVGAYQA